MADMQEMYDRAYDFLCDGNTEEAIAAYQAILAVDPHYVEAVHDLAHAYADAGNLENAIVMANRLTELTPEDPMSFTVLSRFYQQNNMVPEAETAAAKARMLDWKRQLLEKKQAKA
ncbi:MAG: tetratricopeptide repeat protein [Deltaproteobacteria bacterium]|nr:tetratricopeptide repeat protein [Deltaproteobacteria bacterium]